MTITNNVIALVLTRQYRKSNVQVHIRFISAVSFGYLDESNSVIPRVELDSLRILEKSDSLAGEEDGAVVRLGIEPRMEGRIADEDVEGY